MATIQQLIGDIKNLPELIKAREMAGLIKIFASQTADLERIIIGSIVSGGQYEKTFLVKPGSFADKIMQVHDLAEELLKEIENNVENLKKRTCADLLTKMNTIVEEFSQLLRISWKVEFERSIETHSKILSVADKMQSRRPKEVDSALKELSLWSNKIPECDPEGEKIRGAFASLVKYEKNLELEGEVKDFLIAAIETGATLDDLRKPKIDEFIKKHDLSSVLAIKFRI